MTDEQIVKALECCIEDIRCGECPIFQTQNCMNEVMKYARDLLDRKMTEIEWLKKENHQFADIGKMYSEVKSEAIKEFAERLKNSFCISKEYLDVMNIINNLVAEMTESVTDTNVGGEKE